MSVALVTMPRPTSRLRVLQDGEQDCSTCRNMINCWPTNRDDEHIVANLLVCRIQRGIARERSTKLFLRLIRPKLRKMAAWVKAQIGMPIAEAVAEMESVAIESLLDHYMMGERWPPLEWLFDDRYGAVRHWAVRTVDRSRRRRETVSYGGISHLGGEQDFEDRITGINRALTDRRVLTAPPGLVQESVDEPRPTSELEKALATVEDGMTLSATEYRIARFCLQNARGSTRLTDRLHQRMASVLNIRRKNVSRLFAIASLKLVEAAGLRDNYLRARGLTPPKRRVEKTSRALTADEIISALELLDEAKGRATMLDVAWAVGISDMALLKIRRRFGGMSPEAIREALR